MKRKFTLFLSLLLLVCLGTITAQTTINTTIGSTGYTGNNNSGIGNYYITFVIENNTGQAIMLTEVGNYTTTSHNGTTSTLYYSNTSTSGPVNAPTYTLPAPGWTQIATGLVSGITTTGVNMVLTNINFLIPAGAIYRFALQTSGTNYYSGSGVGTASPNTFTVNNITMRTGDYQIASQYVGYGFSNNPRFFTGYATFIPATPCSGTPTAGIANLVSTCPTTVALSNFTLGTNINIQWQSRPVCGGTWTNIAGATNYNYTIAALSQPTLFRAYILCTNGGASDTSNSVSLAAVMPCYCTSAASSTANEDITNVTISNLNNSSPCSNSTYSNYQNQPPARLNKGTPYPFTVQVQQCAGTNQAIGVGIYIDWNKDGVYTAPELLFSTPATSSAGNFTVSGTVTIPATATQTGLTGMRVIAGNSLTTSSITGCANYTYGETEDYLVDMRYAPDVTGTGMTPGNYTATFCSGANVTLTASTPTFPGATVFWKKPDGTYDGNATLNLNNIQPNQSGFYFAYALIAGCPGGQPDTSGARIVQLIVNPTPPPPIVTPNIYYCQNTPFDSIEVFGENLKWYPVSTGGAPSPKPVVNTAIPNTVTYYVSQTTEGCESQRAPVTVTVSPKPQPPTVVSPVGYCQGDDAVPLIANGQNVRWYSVPTGGIGTSIAPKPATNAQGSFTWYATQTIAGCESNRQPVIVNISYRPNGLITLSKPYVCQYDTITLGYFGNALPIADYIWSLPSGSTLVSGSGQGPLIIRFDSAGFQTVRLTIDNGGCVGPQAFIDVPVHLSPKLTIDTQPDACTDQIVSLAITYSTLGIDTLNWDFAGAETVYGSMPRGPFGLRWASGGEKVISVLAIDDGCKSLPSYDTIQIHDRPDATITPDANSICAGDSIRFTAPYEAGASYQWLPAQFFGETNSNTVYGSIDFTRQVILNVTSIYNCKGSDSILIDAKPCCQVYFPSAFSPNGDGRNDRFRMLTMTKDQNSMTSAHQVSVFRIQNRWGQTVFETADERNGWDGTYNGEPQDSGVYNFYVKYKCSDGNFYEEKGEVTLVR